MKKIYLQIFGGCLCIWGMGLVLFVFTIPKYPTDFQTKVDAAVVLTGGKGRVPVGFEIVKEGLAEKLFISGVHKTVRKSELKKLQEVEETPIDPDLGYEAKNTAGNAYEVAAWIRANNINSIRLITTDFHMRRSLAEFRRFLPHLKIIPHPVNDEKKMGIIKKIRFYMGEYNKFLGAILKPSSAIIE